MDYQAPLRDMRFVLHELFDVGAHCELLGNGIDRELIDGVLEEGARYTGQVVAPLNRNSDEEGAKLKDGVVTTPTGFREAYRQYSENGWASMTGPTEYGGQGFPQMVSACFHEMLMAASLSFRVYSGLTEGAVLALYKHGDEALRRDYLAKLVSGEWAGTMCLTEPQAGTDLALLRTRAEAQADGSYAISGSKIFISGGEQDLTENIVHLVLARLADAPAGVKGISLFLVPKFVANPDGSLGEAELDDIAATGIDGQVEDVGLHLDQLVADRNRLVGGFAAGRAALGSGNVTAGARGGRSVRQALRGVHRSAGGGQLRLTVILVPLENQQVGHDCKGDDENRALNVHGYSAIEKGRCLKETDSSRSRLRDCQ